MWILWLVVTVFGLTIGMAIGLSLVSDYFFRPLYILIGFSISGLIVGFGQWILLRSRIRNMWRWIPATAIGLPLGILLGFWGGIIPMAIAAGLFTSVFQWIALRRNLKDSSQWIVISVISWGVGITTALYLHDNYLHDTEFIFGNYSRIGLIIGIIVGVVSGGFVESALINAKNKNDVSKSNAS